MARAFETRDLWAGAYDVIQGRFGIGKVVA